MKKKYKHLFFDLDHTLWDFHTNSSETLIELFEKYKLEKKLQTTVHNFLENYYRINEEKWSLYRQGKIDKETLRKERFMHTFHHFSNFDNDELCFQLEVEYIETSPHKTNLLPGTLEVLSTLKTKYEMHVITNGFSEVQQIKMDKSGLSPFFQEVITSEMIGVNKPHAPIFIESLKRAGAVRGESLMIGDNLGADILGAKNCGIDQVYFNPQAVPHQENVSYEIKELKELLAIL